MYQHASPGRLGLLSLLVFTALTAVAANSRATIITVSNCVQAVKV